MRLQERPLAGSGSHAKGTRPGDRSHRLSFLISTDARELAPSLHRLSWKLVDTICNFLILWVWVGLTLVLETVEVRASTTQDTANRWNMRYRCQIAERLTLSHCIYCTPSQRRSQGAGIRGKRANIAWPWTVNANGAGKFFDTKAEAVAEVEFLMTEGVRNIDVGCMQINLKAHANAFATIETLSIPNERGLRGQVSENHVSADEQLVEGRRRLSFHDPHLNARYRAKVGQIWNNYGA